MSHHGRRCPVSVTKSLDVGSMDHGGETRELYICRRSVEVETPGLDFVVGGGVSTSELRRPGEEFQDPRLLAFVEGRTLVIETYVVTGESTKKL